MGFDLLMVSDPVSAPLADSTWNAATTTATFTAPDGESRQVAVFAHGGRLYVVRVEAKSAGVVLDTLAHSFHFAG